MRLNSSSESALALAAWPARSLGVVRFVTLALAGSLVLAIASKIQVPFWPVPLTLQTLAVIALSAAYGSRLAVATVLVYLAQGFAGLPVFAGMMAGPAYLVGPTAGFLWGYVAAAFVIGLAADHGWSRSTPRLALAMLAGEIIVFAMGFAWLAWFATLSSGAVGLGASAAFAKGVLPFILGDVIKIGIAALAIPAGWKLLERFRA